VIAADGFRYEIRNRVTLCRCGASKNKPFCDGTHAAIKFRDERRLSATGVLANCELTPRCAGGVSSLADHI
jgi:CDGSH-type Zn-finger protein